MSPIIKKRRGNTYPHIPAYYDIIFVLSMYVFTNMNMKITQPHPNISSFHDSTQSSLKQFTYIYCINCINKGDYINSVIFFEMGLYNQIYLAKGSKNAQTKS